MDSLVRGKLEAQLTNSKRSTANPVAKAAQPKVKPPVQRQTNGAVTAVQRALTIDADNGLPAKPTEPPSNPATKFITQKSCAIPVYFQAVPVESETGDKGDLVAWAPFHAGKLLSWWGSTPASTESAVDALLSHLTAQGGEATKLGSIEQMLYCQAIALQAIFSKIAQNAAIQPTFRQQEASLRLAFKAQAQCRSTLEALAEIRHPRAVVFAKQINNAQGHQQVNNAATQATTDPAPAHGKSEKAIQPNELLEGATHERMDARAAGKSIEGDPSLAALATVDRTGHS